MSEYDSDQASERGNICATIGEARVLEQGMWHLYIIENQKEQDIPNNLNVFTNKCRSTRKKTIHNQRQSLPPWTCMGRRSVEL